MRSLAHAEFNFYLCPYSITSNPSPSPIYSVSLTLAADKVKGTHWLAANAREMRCVPHLFLFAKTLTAGFRRGFSSGFAAQQVKPTMPGVAGNESRVLAGRRIDVCQGAADV